MAHNIRITRAALHDLNEIANYTLKTWGNKQAQRYLGQLDATIGTLRSYPHKQGRSLEGLPPGIRCLSHGKTHFVFFRVHAGETTIVRILHQRRDWEALLNTDEPS
ncbi:MAG: type II toxin-antitoxin system RelE/ParE family toxin [Alphaproteobacteria bacterium]|jgi:toxin ParE1/3/4|nr:type II toxin-antitoxin system RelE/ParE family toxin [Rhodospirillaceae bacterium]MBT6205309.1 type II toxin-antitoxin system RelE/ParE family toxin [Rhodospirillaceae bacterium]MBT7611643.1 type II toxin-antitoxin system RelE/ParE family toxin [Rhodospirillaceae bacterium]MBT7645924.1 type II toxin-antitoxin system RelE/ParE family toxin [Rhodospirillaceae bacterium]MDG2480141.1 type II toxin-antitoxin system RelE/ParE family toxin [Alphaproteobacteria bacterium]